MSITIEVEQGKIQGFENISNITKKKYYAFQGIPYAIPPVNDLRFKDPIPLEKWEEPYDATYERNICVQNGNLPLVGLSESEDCLYINISIPEHPAEVQTPKAVIAFIHGGGFIYGCGSEQLYSGDYLMERDVILVTINYRLNVLGFLNLDVPECSGNAGLKDQVLALKWIKKNIRQFGGDPENVTLLGESAGATSVHFHMISPLSKGLFHKCILMSGSALSPWATVPNPRQMGIELAKNLGYQGNDDEKLLPFLKLQPASNLITAFQKIKLKLDQQFPTGMYNIPFAPSVERITNKAFLPDHPKNLMKNATRVPVVCGTNSKEGMLVFLIESGVLELLKNDFSIFLKSNFIIDPLPMSNLSDKIKRYYFGNKEVGMETAEQVTNLFTDLCYSESYDAINYMADGAPVHVYEFCYDGGLNFLKTFMKNELRENVKGASHGDILSYIFHQKLRPLNPHTEENDAKVIKNVTELWTNFAKTGIPCDTTTWKPYVPSEPCYLKIDENLNLTEGKVYGERVEFLKNLLFFVPKRVTRCTYT